MSRVCLVLEGGGNRGVYTSGVLDAFLDNNIEIKSVYGVSAGALNALSYLSKQKGRSLAFNKKFSQDEKYVNYKRFLKGNIVNLDYLFDKNNKEIETFNYEEFEKREKMVVTCTNVVTGGPFYKEIKDYDLDLPYIKASASLPLFSKIVEVDNLKLLDGGIIDSIPVLKALEDGYDKIVVILTRDKNYQMKPTRFTKIYKAKFLNYPNLTKSIINRHNKYNVTRDLIVQFENEGKVMAIYPSEELIINRLEKDESKIEYVYKLGYKDGEKMINKVKEFIGGKGNGKKGE